jgi:hypothetical protein
MVSRNNLQLRLCDTASDSVQGNEDGQHREFIGIEQHCYQELMTKKQLVPENLSFMTASGSHLEVLRARV